MQRVIMTAAKTTAIRLGTVFVACQIRVFLFFASVWISFSNSSDNSMFSF